MSQFRFDMKEALQIEASGERGTVVGRAEYVTAENQYYLRYKSADGRAVEGWWGESALIGA